jgi:hypothetical protein
MDQISIKYNEPKLGEKEVFWSGLMLLPTGKTHEIYFRFTCPQPTDFKPSIRSFLLAYLVPAMHLGLPIHLLQPIDLVTYQNLMEWQEAFASWSPTRLRPIPIKCDIVSEQPRPYLNEKKSITAFSGGVDSCFTALRHTSREDAIFRRSNLKAGLMIEGFDISLEQSPTFELAWQRSVNILESLKLSAYRLKTNLRSLEKPFNCSWEYETHGIWLAASLACYESFFDLVLIPSTYTYEMLKFPWASNPITDPLYSSTTVTYWHDGAAYNKLTKVNKIANHLAVQESLRVCWEGKQLDRNCGKCFKCVATQVCFWLSDISNPSCFDCSCTHKDVARTYLKNEHNRYLFRLLAKEAQQQNKLSLAQSLNKALREQQIIKVISLLKQGFNKLQKIFTRAKIRIYAKFSNRNYEN